MGYITRNGLYVLLWVIYVSFSFLVDDYISYANNYMFKVYTLCQNGKVDMEIVGYVNKYRLW